MNPDLDNILDDPDFRPLGPLVREEHEAYTLYRPVSLPHTRTLTQVKFSVGFWMAAGVMGFVAGAVYLVVRAL